MKSVTLGHKVLCIIINFYWQFFYLNKLQETFANGDGGAKTGISWQNNIIEHILI